ncbi:hypothetical protein [Streptomyces nigrescens]|uniref:Deoxyxylulose-5-phosphate synthase n=2 Tax=Streptomyces nigrescens TaxID=1920 RepID=A0A640TAB5_STRNI|nr:MULTISPECIES: hypothetical protein [Streptomyces]WAT95458.1 hypothetical protein STRLI_001176 [Streptomyces libani subsp. libani]WAU03083.1 hypothetical protein STRNI_001183 [Streptomyces nigrescens]GFE20689.1 hypothetical protein Sliba_11420 [Streptomyces libani subsp. libani]GGV87805.1 hypothetical protein GCM10010500_08830 [Streptomyces libani subsp. libani]
MCFYSRRVHFVCLACRAAWKKTPVSRGPGHCPQCRGELIDAGADLAVPKRRDVAGWRALEAVLRAGLTFHGGCCGTGPGYRPRTPREVQERLAFAGRTGMPVMAALAVVDPTLTDRYGADARTPGRGTCDGRPPADVPRRSRETSRRD